MRPPLRRYLLPLVVSSLLAACGPENNGSPTPPKEFGAMAGKLFGCPSMQGVYAWPPEAGEYAKGLASNRAPWEGAIPLQVYPREMQIWVQQAGGKLVLRARMVNRAANVRDRMAREWSYKEYESRQYSCSGNMLEFDAVESGSAANYGGTGLARGFKLARLQDGGIAVGIKSISTGRSGSLFSWGGQSYGSYNLPDMIYWSWSKLAATGTGDKEPEPIDAYRPGATTAR